MSEIELSSSGPLDAGRPLRSGPRIPYELQEQVIKSLFSSEKWPVAGTLASCAATCSDWRYLAIPGLYDRIEVIGREKYQILENTMRRKDLACGVHMLSLHDITIEERITQAALHTLPRRLDHLKELFMFGPYGSNNATFPIHSSLFITLSQFHSVRYLHLQQIELGSLDVLRRIVGAFPAVETAVFRSVSWKTSENIPFRPLHNATSWQLSHFSLRDCSSDFVSPFFWASPPENASEASRRRRFQRSNGCHPPIHEADVLPISELAKFILNPPEKVAGSSCWEWRHEEGSRSWCLECSIDNRTSSGIPTWVRFSFSRPQMVAGPMDNRSVVRVSSIAFSRDEQRGPDIECLGTLLDDFECLHQLRFECAPVNPNVDAHALAQQMSTLSKPDRKVWLNGSLCDDSNTTVTYRLPRGVARKKGDVCLQTKRQIASRRMLLSHSLIGLSTHRFIKKDREKRVNVAKEQVRIYRELVNIGYEESSSKETLPKPMASRDVQMMEGYEETPLDCQDTADIMPVSVKEDTHEYCRLLAESRFNVAWDLRQLGRYEEAFGYSKDAVGIRRTLGGDNPQKYRPILATSLYRTARDLRRLGRYEEALEYDKDAVEIHRALGEDDPHKYRPLLAESLAKTANDLRQLGRYEEAFGYSKDVVELHRTLGEDNPQKYRPLLAE
ncbi:hypothetical protein NLI96_g8742 [Meripilus lineatus]|uniref:Uncharacterized protein n=1 Tax=Meripilus lineatus TaxID=2056292 RepID=A0AAD5YBQ7_9APHY|nr:hypothetical protein NLI96_g8742 [Physisporinus lineatus]